MFKQLLSSDIKSQVCNNLQLLLTEDGQLGLGFLAPIKEHIFIALLGMASILAFIPILTYVYFANSLTSKEAIMNRNNTGVVLLDRQNRPFFKFYDNKSAPYLPLSDIPKDIQNAVISAEDKEFYTHSGFSLKGMAGALLADVRHGSLSYGGSTITQQLVKNSLLSNKRNFLRKYQEVVLAQEIERRFSKQEILEMYLNSVYFGHGSFGIQSASETYFKKQAKDLNLAESSLLAGILTAPSELDPLSAGLDKATSRQHYVLDEMLQNHSISKDQHDSAIAQKLVFNDSPEAFPYKAPHFAFMVLDELNKRYGEETITRSGFTVKTTLDLDWQDYAQGVVKDQVAKLKPNLVSNGAAVVMDPKTGEIKALVGSADWSNDQFGKVNITTSKRQPGSSFKPYVYVAAMESHLITPASILKDSPITYPIKGSAPYSPRDYDGKFRGDVTVRRALSNSLNIPAVQVIHQLGVPSAVEEARRFGITTLGDADQYGLSLVLGAAEVRPVDMAAGYSVFATEGLKNDPTTILEIKDKQDQTIYKYSPSPQRVIDPEYPFLVDSILSDNQARQEEFGNVLTINRPAAVKTGTTNDYKDSWTVGFTPSLTVAVWVGNNDGKPMDNIAGSIGAAPIWRALMEKFLEGTPIEQFTVPDGIVDKFICRSNGLLAPVASQSAAIIREFFVKGTEPTQKCFNPNPSPSPSGSVQPNQPTPVPSPESPGPSSASPSPNQPSPSQTSSGQVNRSEGESVTIQITP